MANLKIEYVKLSEIKPYKGNAKTHPKEQVEQIKKSIIEMGEGDAAKGFLDPIGIWHNEIVEGHGRYMAAQELGLDTVPVIRLDGLTDEQRRAYTLIHNKLTMNSDFDFDILSAELDDIFDIDMSDFGFDIDLLSLEEDAQKEVVEDDYDEEPPAEPKAKLGDIYQLGNHRLMCGDSTDIESVKKLTGGELMDMLLTDPPYNVALGQSGGHAVRPSEAKQLNRRTDGKIIQNDSWDSDEEFVAFLVKVYNAALEVMKPGAVFYIWYADTQALNFRLACKEAGMQVRQNLIWNKSTFAMGRQDYQWKHEPCLYGWKDGAGHLWASDRKQTTVIDYAKPSKSDIHPTMKPIGLFDYQIKNNTKGNDAVLDLFSGSGTTIMACEQNGRRGYAMELDPRYVDATIDRWQQFTGKKAVLLSE